MPVSFGSIGDIITVCLLVKNLVEALEDSRGSAAEYRELRLELRALEKALLEVEILSRTHASTVKLNALYSTARKAALDCRQPVEAFLGRIKKYDTGLGDTASSNVVRNVVMKVRWQISQKEDITRFRAEIGAHCTSINMLLATVNVNLAQTNHKEISDQLSDANKKQDALLKEVHDRIQENNTLIAAGNSITSSLKNMLSLDRFTQFGVEIKDYMLRIIDLQLATYNMVLSIQGVLSGSLQRSLEHEPFILEDAIGRISPIHVQFINSWDAFDAVLDLRFGNIQGHKKVKNKEYVLQEHVTRREISSSRPWEGAILPGQRIDMSLIFDTEERASSTTCPSCRDVSDSSQSSDIECQKCRIWYQRVTEVFEVDHPPAFSPKLSTRKYQVTAQFGNLL